MKLRLLRPRDLALALRGLARRRPGEAEEYLDAHPEHWASLVEADPHDAADILEALEDAAAADLVSGLDAEAAADVLEEMQDAAAADKSRNTASWFFLSASARTLFTSRTRS